MKMNEKAQQNIGLAAIVLIVLLSGAVLLNNESIRRGGFFSSVLFSTISTCTDTDGMDIYTKGSVSGGLDDSGDPISGTAYDFCYTSYRVMEQYCDNNYRKAKILDCPTGSSCVDGTCTGGSSGGADETTTESDDTTDETISTDAQCSTDVDCCTNEPECGEGRLWEDQELISTYCSGGDVVAKEYYEWSCPYPNCAKTSKSGKIVWYCDYGCEFGGDYGARCKDSNQVCTPNEIIDAYCVEDSSNVIKCNSDGTSEELIGEYCPNGCDESTGMCIEEPTCQDECVSGSTTCSGDYKVVCKDWDGDGCTESPTTSQLILCEYGCSNGACNPAPEPVDCDEGDYGYPYCSGGNIVQNYRFISNNECKSGTKIVEYCASDEECVQEGTGADATQCIQQTCPLKPENQCSGDRTKVLTYTQSSYPDCEITESILDNCETKNQICDTNTATCIDKIVPEYSCTIRPYKPYSLSVGEEGIETITFSISSINPTSKVVAPNEPVFVSLRQNIVEECNEPLIYYEVVKEDTSLSNITPDNVITYPLYGSDGKTTPVVPSECYGNEVPVDFSTEISFSSAGTYNVGVTIMCIQTETEDQTFLQWFFRDAPITTVMESQISDTKDKFTILVEEGPAPTPVEPDQCDQCGGFLNLCDKSECQNLGACQFIPGFLGLFGNQCLFVEDITEIPCDTASDCPQSRCIHEFKGIQTESLLTNPVCENNLCTWNDVTNCAPQGLYCSEATGRCEEPSSFSYCEGNKICDAPVWSETEERFVCTIALRDCETCIQDSGNVNDRFTTLTATCIGGEKPELCGNNYLNKGEECDGNIFRDNIVTCVGHDSDKYESGMLSCDNCELDFSDCELRGCDGDSDCSRLQICKSRKCIDVDCKSNSDCDPDEKCDEKYNCVKDVECENDNDCNSDEICVGGDCVQQGCSDGTEEGECSDENVPLKCVSGELVPAGECCPSGTIFDIDSGTCNDNPRVCTVEGEIRCTVREPTGIEETCSQDNSELIWQQSDTCNPIFCSPGGCEPPVCVDNEDCESIWTPPSEGCILNSATCTNGACEYDTTCNDCMDNPCDPSCDPDEEIVCATDGIEYFEMRVCEAVENEYTVVEDTYCEICEEGEILLFNECQSKGVVVGVAVFGIVIIIAIFGGLSGTSGIGGIGGTGKRIIRR